MTKMSNLKPTNDFSNISFKYVCPECGCNQWYFLKQLQLDGFKDICDVCNNIFEPDAIDTIEIVYKDKPSKAEVVEAVQQEGLNTITLEACKNTLKTFGYDDKFIEDMITKSFEQIQENDASALIKYALENFGG